MSCKCHVRQGSCRIHIDVGIAVRYIRGGDAMDCLPTAHLVSCSLLFPGRRLRDAGLLILRAATRSSARTSRPISPGRASCSELPATCQSQPAVGDEPPAAATPSESGLRTCLRGGRVPLRAGRDIESFSMTLCLHERAALWSKIVADATLSPVRTRQSSTTIR